MSIDVAAPLGEARLLLVLQLLAEGRTEMAEMQIRGTVTLEADLLRRVIDRLANPIESPEHECCDCRDEDPDWDDCPNCRDADSAHCPGCVRAGRYLDSIDPSCGDVEIIIEELSKRVHDCFGGLSE